MKNYFECNIPTKAPEYVRAEKAEALTALFQSIHERMDKLNQAMSISGLCGELFAEGAKMIFGKVAESGKSLLDELSAEAVAKRVKFLTEGMDIPPARMEWTHADVVVDTAFLTTKEWEAIRTIGLGGSDAAVTLGVSPYRTEQELFHDKVGTPVKLKFDDKGLQYIFSYGHKVEDLVIEEFCRRTGAVEIPETRMFSKKGMPFITANIDRLLIMPTGELAVFEAKTTTIHNFDAWKSGKVPVQYVPQCRQYMSVLDDPLICGCYIGCIYGNTPNDYACSFIERDLNAEQEQLDSESEFWNDYVLSGIEPEASGLPDKDIEVFRKYSGAADTNLPDITLKAEDIDIINMYMQLKEEEKELKRKMETVKERLDQLSLGLIEELGQGTKGMLACLDDDGYFEVSFTPRGYASVDKEKLRLVYPEAYEQCVSYNPENSRVFAIKKKKSKKNKAKAV